MKKEQYNFPDIKCISDDNKFSGKKIYCTGFHISNQQTITEILKKSKAIRATRFSNDIDFLICGSAPDSEKVKLAKENEIPILSARDFIQGLFPVPEELNLF